MTIDWNSFTPWASLAGGALIGLATAMFVLLNGRIAGVSGILGGLLRPARGDIAWRIAFLGGLILAAPVYGLLTSLPEVRIDAGYGIARGRGSPGRDRDALWRGMHERPRRVRHVAAITSFPCRHRRLHGNGFHHGFCRPAFAGRVSKPCRY